MVALHSTYKTVNIVLYSSIYLHLKHKWFLFAWHDVKDAELIYNLVVWMYSQFTDWQLSELITRQIMPLAFDIQHHWMPPKKKFADKT